MDKPRAHNCDSSCFSEGSMFLAVTAVSQVWEVMVGSQLMQQSLTWSHLDSLQQLRRDQSQLCFADAGPFVFYIVC